MKIFLPSTGAEVSREYIVDWFVGWVKRGWWWGEKIKGSRITRNKSPFISEFLTSWNVCIFIGVYNS